VSYPLANNNTFASYLPLTGGTLTGKLDINASLDLNSDAAVGIAWHGASGGVTNRWSLYRDTDGRLKLYSNAAGGHHQQMIAGIGTEMFVQNPDSSVLRNATIVPNPPSGGKDGDVWFRRGNGSTNAVTVYVRENGTWYGG